MRTTLYGTTRTPISSRRFPTPNSIATSTSSSSPPTSKVRLVSSHAPLARFLTHIHRVRAHAHRASLHHLRFRHRPARRPRHPEPALDPDTQARRHEHRAETRGRSRFGTQQVAQRAHRRPCVRSSRVCVRVCDVRLTNNAPLKSGTCTSCCTTRSSMVVQVMGAMACILAKTANMGSERFLNGSARPSSRWVRVLPTSGRRRRLTRRSTQDLRIDWCVRISGCRRV